MNLEGKLLAISSAEFHGLLQGPRQSLDFQLQIFFLQPLALKISESCHCFLREEK
jgi:hypothetical protein